MDEVKLKDIKITKLKKIFTPGGDVLRALKENEKNFDHFGEAYFSWIKYGSVKAWKVHSKMKLNLIVPVGKVRFVFISPHEKYKFKEIEIGESKNLYKRISVPPKLIFGFKGLSKPKSLILNIANLQHSKKESKKIDIREFSYKW
mgnify:CR=1 FL=1